ncbi:MAG: FAD-dependent oxidoreductase, partial [Methylobacteriaceae bacterium]|nr:FAD-dependent oxidoreductase [Methylobacteriaceae bacterium]
GAGAAGIAATRCLVDAGVDALLIEARDRLGGRAHTVEAGGYPIDLGCGWLHSADRNPWTQIAATLGFAIDRTPPPWQNHDLGLSRSEREEYRAALNDFWKRLEAAGNEGTDRPASDLLVPGARWNNLVDATSTYINGAELDRVSTLDLARYDDTGVNWRVADGFGTAIARYGRDLPVRLNCPVANVDHSGPQIRIETPYGVIRTGAVIITVSTDVIAAGSIRFTPDLPDKREAAERIPLGNAEKVFLRIEGAEDLPKGVRFFGSKDRVGTGSYHLRPFGRPVIEGYFGGRFARDLQKAGEAEMAAFAIEEIASVLGARTAGRLQLIRGSAWASDPFALGSYSHALPGHADARATLAAPIDDRIFFAGEACSPHDFSTAHGAYETGVAAARAFLVSR